MGWPIPLSRQDAAKLLESFCKKGLCLSGGFALQFYLPEKFRKIREDDIDLIYATKKSRKETQAFLNLVGKETGMGEFRFVEKHTNQQPRREVFEARSPGRRPIYVHVEKTDLRIPMRDSSIKLKGSKAPAKVIIPGLNYLIARLIFGASSPTRTWNRAMDDLAYLCHLMEFNKRHISKKKVTNYLRKLCAGQSALNQRLSNFSARLNAAVPEELDRRVKATRSKSEFDYLPALKKLDRVFGKKGNPDPRIVLSRHVYYLSNQRKKQLAKRFSVKPREGLLWNAVQERLTGLPRTGIERINRMTPAQRIKRLRRL